MSKKPTLNQPASLETLSRNMRAMATNPRQTSAFSSSTRVGSTRTVNTSSVSSLSSLPVLASPMTPTSPSPATTTLPSRTRPLSSAIISPGTHPRTLSGSTASTVPSMLTGSFIAGNNAPLLSIDTTSSPPSCTTTPVLAPLVPPPMLSPMSPGRIRSGTTPARSRVRALESSKASSAAVTNIATNTHSASTIGDVLGGSISEESNTTISSSFPAHSLPSSPRSPSYPSSCLPSSAPSRTPSSSCISPSMRPFAAPMVFLGGSCNPTTWRRDIAIPRLSAANISFFNPQTDHWTPAFVVLENLAKEGALVQLFVIDGSTRALASMLEATELIARGKRVVLVVEEVAEGAWIEGQEVSGRQCADLNRARFFLKDLAARHARRGGITASASGVSSLTLGIPLSSLDSDAPATTPAVHSDRDRGSSDSDHDNSGRDSSSGTGASNARGSGSVCRSNNSSSSTGGRGNCIVVSSVAEAVEVTVEWVKELQMQTGGRRRALAEMLQTDREGAEGPDGIERGEQTKRKEEARIRRGRVDTDTGTGTSAGHCQGKDACNDKGAMRYVSCGSVSVSVMSGGYTARTVEADAETYDRTHEDACSITYIQTNTDTYVPIDGLNGSVTAASPGIGYRENGVRIDPEKGEVSDTLITTARAPSSSSVLVPAPASCVPSPSSHSSPPPRNTALTSLSRRTTLRHKDPASLAHAGATTPLRGSASPMHRESPSSTRGRPMKVLVMPREVHGGVLSRVMEDKAPLQSGIVTQASPRASSRGTRGCSAPLRADPALAVQACMRVVSLTPRNMSVQPSPSITPAPAAAHPLGFSSTHALSTSTHAAVATRLSPVPGVYVPTAAIPTVAHTPHVGVPGVLSRGDHDPIVPHPTQTSQPTAASAVMAANADTAAPVSPPSLHMTSFTGIGCDAGTDTSTCVAGLDVLQNVDGQGCARSFAVDDIHTILASPAAQHTLHKQLTQILEHQQQT